MKERKVKSTRWRSLQKKVEAKNVLEGYYAHNLLSKSGKESINKVI